jgi:hypothetical protein
MASLRRWQRASVLLAPWAFVCVFAAVWLGLLLPRAFAGQAALICVTTMAGLALACFVVAAVTFSRDVLSGRWPPSKDVVKVAPETPSPRARSL